MSAPTHVCAGCLRKLSELQIPLPEDPLVNSWTFTSFEVEDISMGLPVSGPGCWWNDESDRDRP